MEAQEPSAGDQAKYSKILVNNPAIKIVVLGPSGTGKTKFINSYLTPHSKDNFDTKYWITIVDTFSANVTYYGNKLKLGFWDLGGAEINEVDRSYIYQAADVFILCFSTASSRTFEELDKWATELKRLAPSVPAILVGMQTDLRGSADYVKEVKERGEHIISSFTAHQRAAQLGMQYMECSSWSSIGIPAAVNAAIKLGVQTMLQREANPLPPQQLTPVNSKRTTGEKATGATTAKAGNELKRSAASDLKRSGGGLRASATGTRTDGYAASALLGQISAQTLAEEDGKKSETSTNAPAPDPEDGIDDDQRITKSLQMLFTLPVCSMCNGKIPVGAYRLRCFADECDDREKLDFCEFCLSKQPHQHPVWKERVWLPADLSWRLRGVTVAESFANTFHYYATRPCLGSRRRPDGSLGKFQWLTFAEVAARSKHFGRGLQLLGLPPRSFVGMSARNTLEHFLTDFACMFWDFIGVAVHTVYEDHITAGVLNNADICTVVTTPDLVPKYLRIAPKVPTLLHLIVMGEKSQSAPSWWNSAAPAVGAPRTHWFVDIEALGRNDFIEPVELGRPDNVFTLEYTSGSTGIPKGVIIVNSGFNDGLNRGLHRMGQMCVLSYEPLAHSQRGNDWRTLRYGGRVGLFEDRDMSKDFFDDMTLLRPTSIAAVPRVWDVVYGQYLEAVEERRRQPPHTISISHVSRDKLADVIARKPVEKEVVFTEVVDAEEQVLQQFRKLFGGRVRAVTTGGAPTAHTTMKFLQQLFPMVFESYGSMEAGGITVDREPDTGAEVKLDSVPELGYFVTDRPFPRGEILVKPTKGSKGYWKDPKATAETWTADGFVRTGDIGQIDETGKIHIIDRRKNLFKLSQGEWVSPAHIEDVLQQSKLVDQVWVYGCSVRPYVLAVVVPQLEQLKHFADQHKLPHDPEDLAQLENNEELQRLVLKDLMTVAVGAQKLSYEIPRGVIISTSKFTPINGLMTASNKLCRHALTKHFQSRLDALMAKVDADLKAGLNSTNHKVQEMISQTFKAAGSQQGSLEQMGLDSLSAVSLLARIKNEWNVQVSPEMIFDQGLTAERLAEYINESRATNAKVIPLVTEQVSNKEFQLDPDLKAAPEHLPYSNISAPQHILLTGVTGFLGVFLLLDLLKQTTAKIHCLVRAKDTAGGMQRIQQAVTLFHQKLDEASAARVVVVLGDLAEPRLRLKEDQWQQLAEQIEVIYHNGAYVNGVLPYSRLRATNVLGTLEIIKLAFARKLKRVNYVSTMSVLNATPHVDEDDKLVVDVSRIPGFKGYPLSKWIAERLLRTAAERNLPLSIFRPGTISGDTRTGASNAEVYLNRLLASLIQMGCYPTVENSTFEMIPVDYCARAISRFGIKAEALGKTFHLEGRHDPPTTFTKLADMVSQILTTPELNPDKLHEGKPLQPIGFAEWYTRLEEAAKQQFNITPSAAGSAATTAENRLAPLLPYFTHGFPSGAPFACTKTMSLLKQDPEVGPVPPLDLPLLAKYIQFYRKAKQI